MKNILIAANDPGGANAIVPVVRMLGDHKVSVLSLLSGPAKDIFTSNNLEYTDVSEYSLEQLSRIVSDYTPTVFLAGTSEGFSTDKKIMDILPESISSVYVLDFWNSYAERFSKKGTDLAYVPTYICVMDEKAREGMERVGISPEKIVVTGNPHFEHFAEGITTEGEDEHEILFISQPISQLPQNPYGFDEYESLTGLCSVLSTLPKEYHISIRLHPRDDVRKYDSFLSEPVSLSKETTLENALSHAGLILGMFSPVLMQAAVAGKKVLRFMPHPNDTFDSVFRDIVPLTTTEETLLSSITAPVDEQNSQTEGWVVPGATDNILSLIKSL